MMKTIKTILRISCFVLMPLLAMIVFSVLQVYSDYPFFKPAALMLVAFLFLFPLCLIRGKGRRRLLKSAVYIVLVPAALGILVPSYWSATPGFIGGRFAMQWYRAKYEGVDLGNHANSFLGKQFHYEKVGDDAVLFSYPDPPVTLLVSIAGSGPHCTGYPKSAEQRCTQRLQDLVKTKIDQTPNP